MRKENWYSKLYYIFISVLIITIIAIAFILYKHVKINKIVH